MRLGFGSSYRSVIKGHQSLPGSPSTVANFRDSLNTESYAKLYLPAIGNFHKENEEMSPIQSSVVQLVLRGFPRKASTIPDKRLPITLDVLRFLKIQIASSALRHFD